MLTEGQEIQLRILIAQAIKAAVNGTDADALFAATDMNTFIADLRKKYTDFVNETLG